MYYFGERGVTLWLSGACILKAEEVQTAGEKVAEKLAYSKPLAHLCTGIAK